MGRGDNRRTAKVRQHKARAKLKARIKRRIAGGKTPATTKPAK